VIRASVAGMAICCALMPRAAATGAGVAQPPTFSAQDQLSAARALCGNVTRGSATSNMGPKPETVNGFLSPDKQTLYVELLSAPFDVNGAARRLVVFGGHLVEDGEIDHGEAMQTDIAAGVYERRGSSWTLVTKSAELTAVGINGMDPAVELTRLGARRYALLIRHVNWNRGSGMTHVTIYEPAGAAFAERLDVAVSADDCGSKDPCFTYEGKLTLDERSASDPFDLRLAIGGTYRGANGRVTKVPAGGLTFRFSGDGYTPLLTTPALRALWQAMQAPWGAPSP